MALTRVTSGGIAEGVQIKFDSANTPTTPAIAFENDPNTGIYQNAEDELSISTAGVRRVTFKADGSIETGNGTILGGTNPDFDNAANITLYVNQSDKNATDATSNDGGNLNKPFKTIERALLEAAKRSYKPDPTPTAAGSFIDGKTYTVTTLSTGGGAATDFTAIGASSNTVGVSFIATGVGAGTGTATLNNDKFEAFTIMVLPGQYEVDNRPGLDLFNTNVLTTAAVEDPDDGQGARQITDLADGGIWRFNSRNGGVIVPRGTSIVGYDLRKTVVRPKYVPAPFSVDGSITSDSYALRQIALDGAIMLERSRGYIVEQARLAMDGGYNTVGQGAGSNTQAQSGWNSLTSSQEAACIRDIGYFVDALIKDLREGGNENTFVNAESYVDGNGYRQEFVKANDSNITDEIAATRLAFAVAVNAARHIVKSESDNATYYNHISGGSISQPSFAAGNGYDGAGDCTDVVNAVAVLGAIADAIIANPNTYTAINTTYTAIGSGAGTITIPLRKVQGVYEQTAIFKVTGGCYFWQMTFKDALGTPYQSTSFTNGIPTHVKASNSTYSHHRVVAFTYADQRNTDGELDQYYGKIDAWQGRIPPAQTDLLDVRTEEFQIVGDRSKNYTIDTVNSCSPYIFNCSLRSVFGMCGMHTDGSKVAENSFKSMVVAQFTGISLQKDRNVFVQPKDKEGDTNVTAAPNATTTYNDDDPSTAGKPPIFADPDGQYKTDCRHFHIKASNGGFIQVVSVFAVGYADQFLAESGGDMSITNSNSNFGQLSLRAKGSQFRSFKPSAQGRITALIPPRGISDSSVDNSFYSIDAVNTWGQEGLAADSGDDFTDELKGKLANFKGTGGFKLYLQTGATSEADIPELVVTSIDYSLPKVNGEYQTVTKRFLTYGSQGEFALFRDFYADDGVTPSAYRKLKLILETSTGTTGEGGGTTFNISLNTSYDNVADNFADEDNNNERIGYFWDPNSSSVYIKLQNDTATNNFLDGFIFASDSEQTFTFETVFDSNTGATTTQLVSGTKDTLRYRQGFPSNLLTTKYFDDRDSSPEDLLWRVEYTIPKNLPSGVNPKPPEKRFIIKGTRADNGEDNVPYSDYRFMIWDVQEVQAWDGATSTNAGSDGIYYLTIVRADVNKFVDIFDSVVTNTNVVGKIERRSIGISANRAFACENIESVNLFDKDTKLITNVNYLYPSVNQEAPTYNTRTIWNPPQSDSRVMTEAIQDGRRIKDISVPNFKRFHASASNSPFKDIPALQSVTAETVHRLVQALDLRYVIDTGSATSASTDRVFVAPVASWDGRSSQSALGYTSTSSDLYSATRRFGFSETVPTGTLPENAEAVTKFNNFGVQGEALDRRIIVCSLSADGVNSTTRAITAPVLQNSTLANPDGLTFAPIVPLYRPSILRASSHTWEYIGLGSGNYSTGFPNLQTRVLKLYEQFIAQGYENAGGFVASSGTNSAGDFYIGNQVIQAGGTSTVTLNVPKVRKSSESNFVDIENIENRISNAVINITTSGRATAQQNALKDLTNFFNIQKLTVNDTANITNLITDRFFINRSEINNAAFFPEGNTSAYGFVKGAKPEKTGFISTDTNDKLYVSPKYLDAWRVKRQLISAAAVTLDNNRVYIQPYLQSATQGYVSTSPGTGLQSIPSATALTYDATTVNGVNASTSNTDLIKLKVVETAGIASFGKVDVSMSLTGIGIEDYYKDTNDDKFYLNPKVTIPLSYESVDYTTNEVVLSKVQNGVGIIDYLKSYIGGTHNTLIKNYPPLTASGAAGIDASESDVKFLKSKLHADFNAATGGSGSSSTIDPDNRSTYATIRLAITTQAEYDAWPDRGSISLREYQKGGTYYISSYKYRKIQFVYSDDGNSANDYAEFRLFDNYGAASNNAGLAHTFTANYNNNYPGVDSKNVFFTGCDSLVFDSDRWTSESPFIPPLDPTKGVVEEVNIEDAILYRVPEKKLPIAISLDQDYFDRNLPNPYSSKALGVNIQERNEVKRFSPLFEFSQCKQWAEQSGFGSKDELELLMKPGYYKMDGSVFPCSVKINGTGVTKSSIFAGKEQTRTSQGRMGGYLEDTVKRGDSVYLYRTLGFTKQYGVGNDAIYSQISGGLTADGSFNLSNVHLLGINESITKNEIPDSVFSDDRDTQNARRVVRNAYFTKGAIKKESNTANTSSAATLNAHNGNTLSTSGVDGGIDLMMKQSGGSVSNFGAIAYPVIKSGDMIQNDPSASDHYELNQADFTNSRYFSIEIKASDYAANATLRSKFDRMRKYIIPGTTMYYLTNPQDPVVVLSDEATVSNLTVSTKVLSVRKINPSVSLDFDSNSTESIQVLVSVYRAASGTDQTNANSDSYTNDTEDLDTGNWASNPNTLRKIVFLNEDGAEYTTLMYNWALETRRNFLPKGFVHEGGYQGPILKKVTLSVTGATNVRDIVVDSVRDIEVGDRIAWRDINGTDQLNNFRVSGINTSSKTITVSDDIPTGVVIGIDSIVSITKFDVFGDEVTKFDTPEIYGVLRSSEPDQLVLVVDRNPNKDYDTTIAPYPFASGSFGNHPTQLIQLKHEYDFPEATDTTEYGSLEDAALAFNRVKASYQRVNGIENDRFLFIDVNPRGFATLSNTEGVPDPQDAAITGSYLENAGIHRDILVDFANFDQQSIRNGGGFGKGFTQTTVTIASTSTDYSTARTYLETTIANALNLTSTRNYNSRLRVIVSGMSVGTWRFYANINTDPNHGTYKMGEITQIRCYSTNSSSPTVISGDLTIDVIDGKGHVLSQSGRTVSTSSTIGSISSSDFTAVAKANLLAAAKLNVDPTGQNQDVTELGSPYLESVLYDGTYTDDPIIETARGKKIYNTWPKSYRTLRRRFPLAGMPINGNYQSSMISVNSLPGSNFALNLTGVTIGAQSPADSSANTFGGGYRGGLIKCRGAQLTLSGTRFRGNLSLDWMGIGTVGDARAKSSSNGSFVAGHSIEMFQMEDQNSFRAIGGGSPAKEIRTSNLDEEFRQLTEFDPVSNVYLEPGKDPYGRLSDGDARTFPLNTRQAIRRFNKSTGSVIPWVNDDGTNQASIAPGVLLDRVALFERYQTPYGILYDAPSGNPVNPELVSGYIPTANGYASGVMLRWRDTSAAVTYVVGGGENISLPTRTLGFFVVDNVAGQDIPSNIFFGKNATGIVKAEKSGNDTTTFVESTYALVKSTSQLSRKFNIATNGDITESSTGKYIFIQVTFDRNNAFDPLTESTGTVLNFNTDYLDAKRYNYVSTVTSRYAKSTQNNFAKLVVEQSDDNTVYSQPANYAIDGENNTCQATFTNTTTATELYLVNQTNTTTAVSGRALITTNSSRKITSLYITDPGQNHSAGDVLHLATTSNGGSDQVCPGFTLKIRNNYSNEDFSIFNKGEYKVMLPKNCFILNSIENGSSARQLKQQINAAKAIFKPGSYILHNGLYYKIAKSDTATNKSYIGVYRYVNPSNTSDIRADIVIELDDISFNPTYASNTRFDLFDNDNLLNYWPTDGRLVIGNRETCDYVKSGSASDPKGFEIRLTRSMTKYWPHYIRDWEGLDPNNASDNTVSSESIIPTEIRMSDPVDVTCYGLKRFNNSNFTAAWSDNDSTQQADIVNRPIGHTYVTPTGVKTAEVAEICIKAADGTGIIADNEKLSIGQTVTIPYRDSGGSWSTFKVTVGDAQGIPGTSESTNRAGDLYVSGTFKAGFSSSVNSDQTFNIHGDNNNDTKIYGPINPLTSTKLIAGSGTSLRTFDQNGGFRMWGYRSSRAGSVITAANMPNESQGGTTYKSIATSTGIDTNKEGALAFTVSSGYYRSMIDIGSWADFTAKFTQIDVTTDPTECIMEVTAINDGAIYRGQPIYASGTAPSLTITPKSSPGNTDTDRYTFSSINTGTFSNLIGWVVGFDGDTISTSDTTLDGNPFVTSNYEDDLELTGRGGTGKYRVLLNQAYTSANGTFSNLTFTSGETGSMTNVLGKLATTDYIPYGANQAMWWNEPGSGVYRYVWKRRVLDDGTNIVYFRYSNNVGAGLTALYDSSINARNFAGGQTSLYNGAYILFYYQGRRSNTIKLALDKPLCENVDEGTTFTLAPTPNRDKSGLKLFKSRILDIKKSTAHSQSRLKVTLADPLPPVNWDISSTGSTDSRWKNFGYMYINDGGWTYPKTGGSSFRANNVKMVSNQAANTIILPNYSGRIRAGDKITYTWQDLLRIQSDIGVPSITIRASGQTVEIRSGTVNQKNLIHKYIRPGYTIFAESGGTFTELGTCASVDTTSGNITLAAGTLVTISSDQNLHYTTTGTSKSVSSTIVTVSAPDGQGHSTCTLGSTGNHILTGYTFQDAGGAEQITFEYSQHALLSTIGDVFVAHRAGNFQNDGPISKTFIYSDTGVKLTFGEYRLWYENFSNYIQPHDRKKQAISGRQGWVGNFGLDTNGRKTLGISLNGTSSLQLGRQYNGSMWLTAVPVHALWEGSSYSYYMLESDHSVSIDTNYLSTTSTRLDRDGTNKLYALNHTRLTTGAIYGALNTGDVISGGSGAYDTHHYRFASTGIRLKYSLQDGTVNTDGSVTGGSNSRLSEQLVINKVTNYTAIMNSLPTGKGLGAHVTVSSAVTAGSSTTISVSTVNSKKFLPGDCLYTTVTSNTTFDKIDDFIGIVSTVDYSSGVITLIEAAKASVSNGGAITSISATGFWADNGSADSAQKFDSQTLVYTGESGTGAANPTNAGANTTSPNVIGDNEAGYNRFNFRFGVGQRVYNQSTLLNTYTNLAAVNSFASASNVVDVRFGDLATYTSPMLNIEVTRFNAKTHVESSISVVGANLHI